MAKYSRALLLSIALAALIVCGVWYYVSGVENPANLKGLQKIDSMMQNGVPDFDLQTVNGKAFKFSDQKNKIVILSFWATWCAPCVHEFPSMVKLVQSMKGKVTLVTIAADEKKQDVMEFLSVFGGKSPSIIHLWDSSMTIARSYGTEKLPENYIIDRSGKLIKKVSNTQDWMSPEVLHFFEKL